MKTHRILALWLLVAQTVLAQPYEGPDTLWTRVHDLSDIEYFSAGDVVSLTNGGVMIAGNYVTLGETDWGPCLVRLDSSGNLLWRRPCHDSVVVTSYPTHMCQAAPNRFVLAATLYRFGQSDLSVTGCDSEGAIIWQQALNLPDWQIAKGVCAGGDGSAVVVYHTEIPPYSCVAEAMKVDSNGNIVWAHSYSPSGGNTTAQAVISTAGGGYLVLGGGSNETMLLKLNSGGSVESFHYHALPFNEYGAWDIAELADGDYVMCGYALSYEIGYIQAFAWRVSPAGDSLWSWFSDPHDCQATEVLATGDGGFVIRVESQVNLYLRFGSANTLLWQREYSPLSPYRFEESEITEDGQGRFIIAGAAFRDMSSSHFIAAIKTQPDPVMASSPPAVLLPGSITLTTYPNPFNSSTQIEFTLPSTQRVSLRLYDVLGREVAVLMNEIQTAGRHGLTFDASGLPSGLYLCRLEAGEMAQTRKIVLLK